MTLTLNQASAAAPDDPKRLLLQPLDLTLDAGSITLLIGQTGSGKSTLLQLLAGLRAPAAGEVRLDGESLWRKGRVERRLLLPLGLVFQFPEQQLFARTIRHEFAYSLRPFRLSPGEEEQRIREARNVWDGRSVFAPELSPFTLSGGQRRRLALATTAAADPAWLLMDEPTAGLEAAGVLELLAAIRERREAGAGTVIATHDLDTFLPLADRVLVLQDGQVAADLPPRELCAQPDLLLQTRVGLPSCTAVSAAFSRHGLTLPPDRLTAEEMAEAIAAALEAAPAWDADGMQMSPAVPVPAPNERYRGNSDAPSSRTGTGGDEETRQLTENPRQDHTGRGISPSADNRIRPSALLTSQEEIAGAGSRNLTSSGTWLQRLDPRSKWLLYVLLVAGGLLQEGWTGLTIALIPVLLGILTLPRSGLRSLLKFMKPLGIFFALSIGLAGLTLTTDGGWPSFGFSAEQAGTTTLRLYRLLIITLASLWFAVSTPYGRMTEGLNWALGHLRNMKLPVDSFALAVSLIFRFIPMILSEWERFSLIVRARGKAPLRPGTVRFRDIPALVVPLLLSLFQRAENMTTAMEMKGLSGKSLQSARPSLLSWKRIDTMLALLGVGWLAVLIALR
ncbi:ATP-binding cassette domain-containing protein [Paenibacillus filicis]|uniref:ATP-binding cassette domain-containing protein n=1 Tax=Paenibacillus filicis TaxID=669464 RepID=A0ABU9DKJ6_9BACL